MKRILLLTLLIGLPSYAGNISASYSNSKFEEEFHVDQLQSIEMWEQPKTAYTPKNLVTEQQMRFNDKEGTNTYNSYTLHLTDYDTKIVKSYMKDGKFFVQDNLGNTFQTGQLQEIDTSGLESAIENNTININNNRKLIKTNADTIQRVGNQVQVNTNNINSIRNDVAQMNNRMDGMQSHLDRLDNKMKKGLATVSALAALHPNPRPRSGARQ